MPPSTTGVSGTVLLQMPNYPAPPDISKLATKDDLARAVQAILTGVQTPPPVPIPLPPPTPTPTPTPTPPTPTPTPPTPAPTPAAGGSAWPPASFAPSQVIGLPAGTFTGSVHLDKENVTIQGAGMRRTVIDGQGGVGAGHRLAWGKGIIHVGAKGALIQDIGFTGGGGADGSSDGEAAVYPELFDGQLTLQRVAIDGGENGVFMPNIGQAAVDLVLDQVVIGRQRRTALADGRSHNCYVAGRSVTVTRSILLASNGHCFKSRSPKVAMSDCFLTRDTARWIDLPGGTNMTSQRNVFVTLPGTNSQNALGFFDENDLNANPGQNGSFVSTDDTFYFWRQNEVIWINSANFSVEFHNPTVFWIGAPGATPPHVTIQGPGHLTGDNPFVFNEANRRDLPPPVPGDPA